MGGKVRRWGKGNEDGEEGEVDHKPETRVIWANPWFSALRKLLGFPGDRSPGRPEPVFKSPARDSRR